MALVIDSNLCPQNHRCPLIEAMAGGGTVVVTAERDAGGALVRVRDSGPGIAAELLPRLFEPFSSLGKKNGMGLGLALSRQTLLDQGGDLTLDRDAGPGAAFLLRFPR